MNQIIRLLISLLIILMVGSFWGCTSNDRGDEGGELTRDLTNRATTGDASSGDRETTVDPKLQYTNMGGDNQLDQATLEVKRDINNSATGSSQFAFQSNASLSEANNMLRNDSLLSAYTKTMERLNVLVSEAADMESLEALVAQLDIVGGKYAERYNSIMERSASMGKMEFPNLTNLTVTNNSFTVAGAEAKALPDAYATAAQNIVEKVAQLKARSPGAQPAPADDDTGGDDQDTGTVPPADDAPTAPAAPTTPSAEDANSGS